jgi:magnesium transporter
MIRSVYCAHGQPLRFDLGPDQFASVLKEADGLLWVDLAAEPPDVCLPILRDTFGFHPLAVEDALEESHVPKVDDWGQYLYLVLHGVIFDLKGASPDDDELLDTLELDLFVGENYLVSYQARAIGAIDRVWELCQRDVRHLERGSENLLYMLADELVSDYMPVVEAVDEAIDDIEDEIFGDPGPHLLERVFALKRALLHLRRIIAPQREVLNKLARGDYATIRLESRVFFRDVYDHLVRMYDITEGLRDLVSGALDTYLSVVSNRMNEVMRTLTVITTLFMPISFLVGFFGTNFFHPVEGLTAWTSPPAFVLVLLALVLLPVGMYLWMRSRAWM